MYKRQSLDIVEIWVEKKGKHEKTCIKGWNLDDDSLKAHLNVIKKKRGCNGSIKKENSINIIKLHGNVSIRDFIILYLKENGVNEENIKVKI